MSRLYDFRPGYGYAYPNDPFFYRNHDANDGVFLIDMATGHAKLILSLQEIWDFSGAAFDKDEKMIINHINLEREPALVKFCADAPFPCQMAEDGLTVEI
jgi:hypothetical protein